MIRVGRSPRAVGMGEGGDQRQPPGGRLDLGPDRMPAVERGADHVRDRAARCRADCGCRRQPGPRSDPPLRRHPRGHAPLVEPNGIAAASAGSTGRLEIGRCVGSGRPGGPPARRGDTGPRHATARRLRPLAHVPVGLRSGRAPARPGRAARGRPGRRQRRRSAGCSRSSSGAASQPARSASSPSRRAPRSTRSSGSPGRPAAGKSTLTDRLISWRPAGGAAVGVLAVDPSSPFSGGAILGDRIRMQRHTLDDGVFIRSMATRGHQGGLAAGRAGGHPGPGGRRACAWCSSRRSASARSRSRWPGRPTPPWWSSRPGGATPSRPARPVCSRWPTSSWSTRRTGTGRPRPAGTSRTCSISTRPWATGGRPW